MSETLMRTIFEASLTAGIAAAVVMLLRIPMKKVPKRWSYILWAVVFFRCLCPFSVESAVSIFNAVPEQSISEMDILPEIPETSQDISGLQEINQPADYYGYDSYDDPVYTDYSGNANFNKPEFNIPPVGEITADENSADEIIPDEIPITDAERNNILFAVWTAGAAGMILYAVISYGKLMRKVKFSVKADDGVYETDLIPTAFSAGFFPPKIYIPCGLSQKERELIIAHEQVHIKRLDYITKPLAFLGLALHWFNPMIWIAFAFMTRDMELSCDEAVLEMLGSEEKKAYSQALLRVSMKRSGLAALPLAFAGTGIKERVKNVLSYKKPRIIATVIAAVVVLTACVVLGTNAVRNSDTGIDSYDENSLTLIENEFTDAYHMIEIENSAGDRIILLNSKDRFGHEYAGLNSALFAADGRTISFDSDISGVDINIDPAYITKVVITDLQILHNDVYDSGGESGSHMFVAIDMELQMTDDYVMPPSDIILKGDKEHGTLVGGGNSQRYGIYAEIEIDKIVFGDDYFPGIMLTGFRSDYTWISDTELYVTDNLKITNMNFGQTTAEEKRQQEEEEARRREEEEESRRRAEENISSFDYTLDPDVKFDSSTGAEDNTAYLLASPAEDVRIYGAYFDNGKYPKIIIGHDGIADEFLQDWLTPRRIPPTAFYRDYDGDGENELAVSYYVGSGTGVSVEELVIYKKDESGHFIEYKLDPTDTIRKSVSITVNNSTHEITYEMNGKTVTNSYPEGGIVDGYFHDEGGVKPENIGFDTRVGYGFGENNEITLTISPDLLTVYSGPDITAKVNFTGNGFRLTDIDMGLDPEEQAELERQRVEMEQLEAEKRHLAELFPSGLQVLEYPVENHTISETYGMQALGDEADEFHKGIDFPVAKGTPVYASADGKVISSRITANGYGNTIIIDHGNELTTLYAHLNERIAEEGDEVKTGDLIGYSGKTGNAFGDVLHFEVRVGGQHTDPMQFLKSDNGNNNTASSKLSDGGNHDLIPGLIYNSTRYEISEEITSEILSKKYRDGSLEPIAEVASIDKNLFVPNINSELSSNFLPVGSKIYKYEGGAKIYDTNGEPISSMTDDDLAIVVVYELNGEHTVILKPVRAAKANVNKTAEPVKWFDYHNSDDKPYGKTLDLKLEEFPNTSFHFTEYDVTADDGKSEEKILSGMPIWSVYLYDLTGDGLPEFCASISMGSGFIDDEILVYDYASEAYYTLADRFKYDYFLTSENGVLMVNRTESGDYKKENVVSGKLVFDGKSLSMDM